jgi:hypothetical protein
MSLTIRFTSGMVRFASSRVNRLGARDGETDFGVSELEPAMNQPPF